MTIPQPELYRDVGSYPCTYSRVDKLIGLRLSRRGVKISYIAGEAPPPAIFSHQGEVWINGPSPTLRQVELRMMQETA